MYLIFPPPTFALPAAWAFYTGGIILSTLTMTVVILICNITKNYVLESMAIAEELVELHVVEDHDLDDTEEGSDEEDTKSTQVIDEESSLLSSEQVANSAGSGYQQHQHAHHEHSRSHGTDYYGSTWVNPCYETFEEAIEHTKPADVYAHHHQYEEVHQEPAPRPPILIEARYVGDGKAAASASSSSASSRLVVKQRKFEITALCRLFLGAWGEKTYVISIALDIYGCLWGFTSVFASSLALALPFGNHYEADYTLYALVYAILVIPLSCLELKEQVMFQVMYSCCRFLIIFVMIITSLVAIDDENNVHFTNMPDGAAEPTRMFKFDGFYTAFSVLVFTSIMHAAIPVLSQPVHDKTKLSSIFKDTFLITGVLFWLLGYSVTTYFGSSIEQASNLNWSTYVGGSGGPSPNDPSMWINVAWWARTMSMFVLGFPALNVISSFPLNTVALGNNLMAAVFGDGVHEAEVMRRYFGIHACIHISISK